MTLLLNAITFHEPNQLILALMAFSGAYAMTFLIETPIYAALLRKFCTPLKAVALSGLINSITLPVVWFVLPPLLIRNYLLFFVVAELFAWLGEALLVKLLLEKVGWKRALIAALAANAVSAAAGLAVAFVLAPNV